MTYAYIVYKTTNKFSKKDISVDVLAVCFSCKEAKDILNNSRFSFIKENLDATIVSLNKYDDCEHTLTLETNKERVNLFVKKIYPFVSNRTPLLNDFITNIVKERLEIFREDHKIPASSYSDFVETVTYNLLDNKDELINIDEIDETISNIYESEEY